MAGDASRAPRDAVDAIRDAQRGEDDALGEAEKAAPTSVAESVTVRATRFQPALTRENLPLGIAPIAEAMASAILCPPSPEGSIGFA
jgi:hypothetical protein